MKYFFIGFVTALPFTISFGPVFFAITETSLKRGFKAGTIVAFGILLSDFVFVMLIGLGFAALLNDEFSKFVFSLLGGIMLLIFGISFLKKKIDLSPLNIVEISRRPVQSFIKGFLINSLNPYVALFWTGVVALATSELDLSGGSFIAYFAGFLLTLLISDLIKSWLAESIRKKMTTRFNIVYRLLGFVFIGFGLKFLWESVIYFWNN